MYFFSEAHQIKPVDDSLQEDIFAYSFLEDLNTDIFLKAYTHGLFAWPLGTEAEIINWWCPKYRSVIIPAQLKVAKSMRPIFNQRKFTYTLNTQFLQVINNCSETPRKGQDGTWLSDYYIEKMYEFHKQGWAHSIEVWQQNQLVGGIYGILIGRVFCGESMYAHSPNASKAGLTWLLKHSPLSQQIALVDCQYPNPHLQSLGAQFLERAMFLQIMEKQYSLNPNPIDISQY